MSGKAVVFYNRKDACKSVLQFWDCVHLGGWKKGARSAILDVTNIWTSVCSRDGGRKSATCLVLVVIFKRESNDNVASKVTPKLLTHAEVDVIKWGTVSVSFSFRWLETQSLWSQIYWRASKFALVCSVIMPRNSLYKTYNSRPRTEPWGTPSPSDLRDKSDLNLSIKTSPSLSMI